MDLIDVTWRKATTSTENGGACVEVASISSAIAIRDSKDPHGPVILISNKDFRNLKGILT